MKALKMWLVASYSLKTQLLGSAKKNNRFKKPGWLWIAVVLLSLTTGSPPTTVATTKLGLGITTKSQHTNHKPEYLHHTRRRNKRFGGKRLLNCAPRLPPHTSGWCRNRYNDLLPMSLRSPQSACTRDYLSFCSWISKMADFYPLKRHLIFRHCYLHQVSCYLSCFSW